MEFKRSEHSRDRQIGNIMRVDVTIATKNSARTLERCIGAIRQNIPLSQLVVVDGGSTDNTVAIAKSLGAEVKTNTGLLGNVRYVQAQACNTEWIAIIDSDVYVYPTWWSEVSQHISQPDVGMILAIGDSPMNRLTIYGEYLAHIAKRFGTAAFSNTLVRRDLILSCRELLDNIHAGEDTVFARYLDRVGMRVLTIQKRLVYHDKNVVDEHPQAFFRWGQSLRIRGRREGMRELAKTLKNNARNWWIFTKETHKISVSLLFFLLYLWLWTFLGYVNVPKPTSSQSKNAPL